MFEHGRIFGAVLAQSHGTLYLRPRFIEIAEAVMSPCQRVLMMFISNAFATTVDSMAQNAFEINIIISPFHFKSLKVFRLIH